MARQRSDILSDLRLANFNRSPLKVRLALLLELNENDDDIVAHAGERLVEMHDEIRVINKDSAESHAVAIREFVSEYETYRRHAAIKAKYHQDLKHTRDDLKPLWNIILGKEEDNRLEGLRLQFEQVPSVDWNSSGWIQNAEQAISICRKILQECEQTWVARDEQAEELKREIGNAVEKNKLEKLRRQYEQMPPINGDGSEWMQNANQTLRNYRSILQECETTWHVYNTQAEDLKREINKTVSRIQDEMIRRS